MVVFDNKTYCDICFLEHKLEDCIAINVIQHLNYYEAIVHSRYQLDQSTAAIIGGVFKIIPERLSGRGIGIPFKEFECGLRLLKFCGSALDFMETYAGPSWIKYPIRNRKYQSHDWFLRRFPHMRELTASGDLLIEQAFVLACEKSGIERTIDNSVEVRIYERT